MEILNFFSTVKTKALKFGHAFQCFHEEALHPGYLALRGGTVCLIDDFIDSPSGITTSLSNQINWISLL